MLHAGLSSKITPVIFKKGEKEPIYFADSVHPEYQTQLVYGWIPKGERKEIPTTARQPRVNIIGGICLNGHRFFYQQADTVDADSIALFLAEGLAIKIHYLPPYSPNLNPIERMWKLMRENVMYNKYYASFEEFTDGVIGFFNTIGRKKSILRARINDNFHVLHSPILAS